MLILFSSEKALTLLKRSAIIKSSKRARGGKPGRRRKKMKYTISYGMFRGEIKSMTIEANSEEEAEKKYRELTGDEEVIAVFEQE